MSIRAQQVGSEIHEAVQMALSRGDLHDPRIRGLITVTGVTVTDDLAEAQVSVSVLPAVHAELTMHGLRSAAPLLRREVTRRVRMRTIPRLTFRLDDSLKKQAAVAAAIREAVGDAPADATAPNADEEDHPGGDESP